MLPIIDVSQREIVEETKLQTRKNCFSNLKLMSPLNAAICTTTYLERQKCYGPGKKILFKKQLFDLEVTDWKKVIHVKLGRTVLDT